MLYQLSYFPIRGNGGYYITITDLKSRGCPKKSAKVFQPANVDAIAKAVIRSRIDKELRENLPPMQFSVYEKRISSGLSPPARRSR